MSDLAGSTEYSYYLEGCIVLGMKPISLSEFRARWTEFQAYAEQLQSAEEAGSISTLDPEMRKAMQARFKNDPIVDATLAGMASLNTTTRSSQMPETNNQSSETRNGADK
ncbi:MAG TPA: hypothetical protein VGS41_12655 [Chthonomonadales bacterium]|nr:hypothetical protein [Chthonomonadales bacterium]